MGRFRYDDNEEDEYDIDKNCNNNNSSDLGWEFVASNPGEEGALVSVENNNNRAEIFEDHFFQQHDTSSNDNNNVDPTTVSSQPQQKQQQQQPTFYVVMQQDPMGIYNNIQGGGGYYEYERSRGKRSTSYCCPPTWVIMCLVAIISHIVWHAIYIGPPAPPAPIQLSSSLESDDATEENDFSSSTTHRTNSSPIYSSLTWQDYWNNHSTMFLHSTRALFWEIPKHIVIWWYRYIQDQITQRYKKWNNPYLHVQYCSVSLSSSHERMTRFIQQSTTIYQLVENDNNDDHDDYTTSLSSSSLSLQAGLFVAKLQPLAIRAVADALHTWRPKTTTLLPSSSSISYPPLLLFASAMTPGLAMYDFGTMLSRILIPVSDCEKHVKYQQQQQQRRGQHLLRPLLHLDAAFLNDWDPDNLAREILNHVQEWSALSTSSLSSSKLSSHDDTARGGGGIVILQNVHQLKPTVFAWLVRELSTPPTPHGSSSSSSSSFSSSSSLYLHCQNVIFLFTSDTIGKSSIVRSIRQAATSSAQQAAMVNKPQQLIPVNEYDDDDDDDSTNLDNNSRIKSRSRPRRSNMDLVHDISRPSLTLDIQHEIQLHFGGATAGSSFIGTSMHAILPFLPYTQTDLADIVTLGMQQYWQESCHYCHYHHHQRWSRLEITRDAVQALVHERNVEYIVWKTVMNKSQKGGTMATTTTTAASGGGERQLPVVLLTFSSTGADPVQRYLVSLQVHLEQCLQKASTFDANGNKDDNNHNNPHQEQQQEKLSQSFKILVLDSSDDDNTGKRGILKECQQQQQYNDDVFITDNSLTSPTSACTEICSFPLV